MTENINKAIETEQNYMISEAINIIRDLRGLRRELDGYIAEIKSGIELAETDFDKGIGAVMYKTNHAVSGTRNFAADVARDSAALDKYAEAYRMLCYLKDC